MASIPINPRPFLHSQGVRVIEKNQADNYVSVYFSSKNNRPAVLGIDADLSEIQKRLVLSYALGRILEEGKEKNFYDTRQRYRVLFREKVGTAEAFTLDFLIPEKQLREQLQSLPFMDVLDSLQGDGLGIDRIRRLCMDFGVSASVLLWRLQRRQRLANETF